MVRIQTRNYNCYLNSRTSENKIKTYISLETLDLHNQTHNDTLTYTVECCQPAGVYDFVCTTSFDHYGWGEGYIQIGDSQDLLCSDFTTGVQQTIPGVTHGNGAGGNVQIRGTLPSPNMMSYKP